MKYKALIVDDEKLARLDLRNVLNEFEEIEIVGEAKNISQATQLINKLHPNLIFLDIQLRGETGFDLLSKVEENLDYVFVTAYDKYAIRAFDVNALDYLLKPVSAQRLRQTIEKLNDKTVRDATNTKKLNYEDVIFLMLNNNYCFLKIESIIAITSYGDYTTIYTDDNSHHITRKTMKDWDNRLPENHFCRIHRETIVNLAHIARVIESSSNTYRIILKGMDKSFLMSRRYVAKIKERFT